MSLQNYCLCPLPLSPTTAKAWDSQGSLGTGLKLHKGQPAWMPLVCLLSDSEHSSHSSFFPVILCLLSFLPHAQIAVGAPSSSESLENTPGAEHSLWERAGSCTPLPPSSCDPAVSSHQEECVERAGENTKFSTWPSYKVSAQKSCPNYACFCELTYSSPKQDQSWTQFKGSGFQWLITMSEKG